MARPTNKEKEERKILLKYFKRDSEIYTNFEEVTKNQSKKRIIYTLLDLCSIRNCCNIIGGICCTFNNDQNNNILDNWEEEILYKELMNIDVVKHDYYCSILAYSQSLLYEAKTKKDYRAYQMIDEVVLVELFGEKRVKEFDNRGYPHYLLPLLRKLTDQEKEKLKQRITKNQFGTNTIIKREYANKIKSIINQHNNLLVELDFTKPILELQEYIKFLHEEYQNNKILDIFDYLNIKRINLQFKDHDIYKKGTHRPFNILLADKLFVYDGKKNGLNNKDIQNEINRYRLKLKNIDDEDKKYDESLKDKIGATEVNKYFKTMRDLIENGGFQEFLNGYK